MNTITKELLGLVSDLFDKPNGAYNIRPPIHRKH